jgi:hypothetical protein
MKRNVFFWRYLTLMMMLFGAVSVSQAETNKITGDLTSNSTLATPVAGLTITPEVIDLQAWPIGGWQEGVELTLTNTGEGAVVVSASELDDADRNFAISSLDLPLTLAEDATANVAVNFVGIDVAAGTYRATYVASWGTDRSVSTVDVVAEAYVPARSDIKEKAELVTLPAVDGSVSINGVSTRDFNGFHKNYVLPNDVVAAQYDKVTKFTVTEDILVDFNMISGTNTNIAIYAADFNGEAGPMATNALAQDLSTISGFPMFVGTYYLVVSADAEFNLETVTTPMTVPAAVTYVAPVDGAVDVVNGTDLVWNYSDVKTIEYQVLIGTTYPPTDVVVDWTVADLTSDSYELAGLLPNLQYFWQVNVKNNVGVTNSDVVGFTTTITPALNVAAVSAELFVGADVELTWESPLGEIRALLGYNVYRDGVKINDALVAGLTFTDDDATALVYNMTGYTYNVTSVFDEGESAYSNDVLVKISGEGTIAGTVTEAVAGAVIADATLTIEGTDEFGNEVSYTATSNATGNYTQDAKVGEYNMTIVAEGYLDGAAADVAVVYNTTTTENVVLSEIPYALANVVATELDDDEVHLEWTFEASTRELVDFTVFRGLWNQDFAAFTEVGSTTQTQFVDYDWGVQTSGVYRWAVVANYSLSQSVPVFSAPLLDKDMETVVNVAVTLNSAETPAGTEVKLTNTSEPALELVYETTLTETGLFTFDNFRKGTYEVSVNLFGYETVNEIKVVSEETDLTYLLVELLNAANNLYVNPNGYATWGLPTEAGLEMFSTDFAEGIPSEITITNSADDKGIWKYESSRERVRSSYSSYGESTDTRMNTPKIALDENTVLEFDWMVYKYGDTELTYDISLNGGLTWITLFTASTSGEDQGAWYTTTIDVAGLGYNSGDAIFSAHKTDAFGWNAYIDNLYVGPATATAGTVAISENIGDQNISKENLDAAVAGLRIFDHNSLALNAETSRSLETFKVSLDGVFSGNTTDMFYDYEVEETLVEGTVYTAKVEADYTTGLSEPMEYTFTYHACDYYNTVADLTATRVEGTMNIELAWTNDETAVDADVFVGTKVYRDGVYVETVAAGTSTFIDEGLVSGDYTYVLTQIYASDAESCEVTVDATMTPGGFVNGFVKEFAGDNTPIEGATVTLTGATSTFSFTTDATGYYEGEVVEGTFDYEVTAATYASETLEAVVIDFGATVVKDFLLKEFPYTVGDVIATEMNENTVQVDWSGTGGGGGSIEEWLRYDDGTNEDGIGGPATFSWATKYDPAQLVDLAGTSVTKIQLFNRTDVVNKLQIFEGTNAATLLYEQDLTGLTVEDWNEVVLTTAVPIDNTKELWITIYTEAGAGFPAAVGPTQGEPNGDLISLDGATWMHLSDVPLDGTWNLATFVTDMNDRTVALGNVTNSVSYKEVNAAFAPTGITNNTASSILPNSMRTASSTRALTGYNVYRGACGSDDEDMVFMGYTLDMQFTDNTWGNAENGIYTWAVEAVYDYNEAEFVYSNCLDKDMVTTVSVEVTTNSADSPEGTAVAFTNVSEPADPAIVFETELDATGVYAWDDFRKGTYDITVQLNGFNEILVEGVEIWEASEFTYILEEIISPVSNLYVTPLGYATWSVGASFEASLETFDAGLPETWTITDGGTSTDTWVNVETFRDGSLDGTKFMVVDSDGAGSSKTLIETLTSPVYASTEAADELFIQWDQNFQSLLGGDLGTVEVFDGSDWIEVISFNDDDEAWPAATHHSINVTEYANDAFQTRFTYMDNGTWAWYWAIDNFAVTETSGSERELSYFKVFHDANFITDTENTFYQYGDNDEVLVPGDTYMAEVAVVYSTGMSERMFYEWTFIPCDSFPGPEDFAGEVEDLTNVRLTWGGDVPPPPPTGEFSEDFESGTLPTGWVIYDEDGDSYNWINTALETGIYEPHSGEYCMTSASYLNPPGPGALTPDNYLVTPAIDVTATSELKFWVAPQDVDYPNEQYYVKISTTGNAVADFTTTIHEGVPTTAWGEVTVDLSTYGGQTVYIAFEHANCTDNFYLKLDDVSVSNTSSRAAYTAPVAAGVCNVAPFRTSGMTQAQISDKLASINTNVNVNEIAEEGGRYVAITGSAKQLGSRDRELLFNNGPLVNSAGTGTGGADESILQSTSLGMNSLGGGVQFAAGNHMAEDFTVDATWTIDEFTFYGYQTGSTTTSTFTGGYVQIYDGDPSNGGTVVWGDMTTNRMTSTTFSNIYRISETTGGTSRPIMEIVCGTDGLVLEAGSYWVEYTLDGSLASGPWAPPITITGETTTGNAKQLTSTGWADLLDTGTSTQQGLPLLINGTAGTGGGGGSTYPHGELLGANIYRDGVLIAELVQAEFYLDTEVVPGFYDYCITYVYESGAESCEICINDLMVPEDCVAPKNLTATLNQETYDDIYLAWNQAEQVEYRYDDGVATGQLGSGTGTTNTVLGNVHRVDASLNEMSWYLTAEGGPHSNIDIFVLGLDAAGVPDGSNVLFTSSVSNTDEQWNTFTFNTPLDITGGFFLGVSFNGFVGIGTDDGAGDPYVFENNTHYFVGDYTAGGWETWETYNFSNNGMIRATGMESAVASYAVESINSDATSDFTMVKSAKATLTGAPDWNAPAAPANRAFTGYNIYRGTDLIEEGYQETTYTDSEGLVNGSSYCYTVTAVYSVCGESEASNEACISGYVGIPTNVVSNVSVYPNPATSLVNVTSSQEMTRISVINYVGQVVYQSELNNENAIQLNTSSFENGVYVVRLDTENGVVTKRVIIAQ